MTLLPDIFLKPRPIDSSLQSMVEREVRDDGGRDFSDSVDLASGYQVTIQKLGSFSYGFAYGRGNFPQDVFWGNESQGYRFYTQESSRYIAEAHLKRGGRERKYNERFGKKWDWTQVSRDYYLGSNFESYHDTPIDLAVLDFDADGDEDVFIMTDKQRLYLMENYAEDLKEQQQRLKSPNIRQAEQAYLETYFHVPPGILNWQQTPFLQTNDEFSQAIRSLSGPAGSFFSRNDVTNEFYHNQMAARIEPKGGAYLGVGPYQNYSFILAAEPRVAILLDVRRDNMLQHLIAKALMVGAPSRYRFLCRLMLRAYDSKLEDQLKDVPIAQLLDFVEKQAVLTPSEAEDLFLMVIATIQKAYGVELSAQDVTSIYGYLVNFQECGGSLRYGENDRCGSRQFKSWRETMINGDTEQAAHHWLASDHNYQVIRQLHLQNRIVPIVADVTDKEVFARLSQQLRDWDLTVHYFYISNVEWYFFSDGNRFRFRPEAAKDFVANLAALPTDESSVLIRSLEPVTVQKYKRKSKLKLFPQDRLDDVDYWNDAVFIWQTPTIQAIVKTFESPRFKWPQDKQERFGTYLDAR